MFKNLSARAQERDSFLRMKKRYLLMNQTRDKRLGGKPPPAPVTTKSQLFRKKMSCSCFLIVLKMLFFVLLKFWLKTKGSYNVNVENQCSNWGLLQPEKHLSFKVRLLNPFEQVVWTARMAVCVFVSWIGNVPRVVLPQSTGYWQIPWQKGRN